MQGARFAIIRKDSFIYLMTPAFSVHLYQILMVLPQLLVVGALRESGILFSSNVRMSLAQQDTLLVLKIRYAFVTPSLPLFLELTAYFAQA